MTDSSYSRPFQPGRKTTASGPQDHLSPGNDAAHAGATHAVGETRAAGDSGSFGDGGQAGEHEILSLLARVIRRDIVPNLITANRVIGAEAETCEEEDGRQHHGAAMQDQGGWKASGFNAARAERDMRFANGHIRMVDVARFVRLLRGTGADAAPALIEVLTARGTPRSELYLDLLGPAARMIGDMWQDDECSFADVTMVVARLHQILNGLRGEQSGLASPGDSPSILLSAAPGEQHSFGVAVVEAVFQEAGWQTQLSHTNDAEEILDQVRARHFDAVGLSMSHDDLADVLRATIMRLRAMSANRDVLVLVGGPAFQLAPHLAAYVGADQMVGAAREAVLQVRELLPRHDALYV